MVKRKLLIFGTGKTATKIYDLIDFSKAEINAFIDNNYEESYWNNIIVYRPFQIMECKLDFDFILVASVYTEQIVIQLLELGIPKDKIIRIVPDKKGGNLLLEYAYLFHNPFKIMYDRLIHIMKKPELLITGISYHQSAINSSCFNCEAHNLAIRGQDIFYDFAIIKHLFDNFTDKMSHVKNVIIGLSYYSFEYDFSKSSSYIEAIRYYPIIGESHNLCDVSAVEDIYNELQSEKNKYELARECLKKTELKYMINEEEGKIVAEMDCNKMFPITRCENRTILNNYISFLLDKGIKPIIAIMPVTKYYAKYFSKSLIKEFYSDLYKVLDNRDIQVLDYFDILDYPDEYFYHVSHLNKEGGIEFTKQLISDIKLN